MKMKYYKIWTLTKPYPKIKFKDKLKQKKNILNFIKNKKNYRFSKILQFNKNLKIK